MYKLMFSNLAGPFASSLHMEHAQKGIYVNLLMIGMPLQIMCALSIRKEAAICCHFGSRCRYDLVKVSHSQSSTTSSFGTFVSSPASLCALYGAPISYRSQG
ncbi:hypothetical protein Dimus_018469 [Dionaea muscipula]